MPASCPVSDEARSVLIVDDHPVVALGLRIALASSQVLTFIGAAATPSAGLSEIASLKPDCLVLDLVFAGSVELALVERARALAAEAVIVVFTSLPHRLYAQDVLWAGADAFLAKSADMNELTNLIAMLAGQPRRPRADAGTRSPNHSPVVVDGVHLTPREAEVARHVSLGLSADAIAASLGLSPRTVAVHRDSVRRKLDCRNTKELVARLARLDVAGG